MTDLTPQQQRLIEAVASIDPKDIDSYGKRLGENISDQEMLTLVVQAYKIVTGRECDDPAVAAEWLISQVP